MDENTTVKELRDRIRDFSTSRGFGKAHNAKNLASALSVEASELVEIFQWIDTNELTEFLLDPEKFEHIREEVADVFWYLTEFCNKLNIDLSQAVIDKEAKNAKKYPLK